MLAKWLQILPVFLYKRLALNIGLQEINSGGVVVVEASKDVLIVVRKEK